MIVDPAVCVVDVFFRIRFIYFRVSDSKISRYKVWILMEVDHNISFHTFNV